MTRDVLFQRLRFYLGRTLLAILSAYVGSVVCWVVTVICSALDPQAVSMTFWRSSVFLLLMSGFLLFFGNTGLLLFIGFAVAIRNLQVWRNRLLFILGSTLTGFLGVLLGPMPALWRFPHENPSPADWRFYLLGTSIGLASGCIFLLLTYRRQRIQGTS